MGSDNSLMRSRGANKIYPLLPSNQPSLDLLAQFIDGKTDTRDVGYCESLVSILLGLHGEVDPYIVPVAPLLIR